MSLARIRKRRRAVLDLISHADYLAQQKGMELAESFLSDAEQALDRLALSPQIGFRLSIQNPLLLQVRKWRVSARFRRYLIVYLPLEDGIDVLHVFHSSQDYPSILEQIARLPK